jgi:hypothetical protein
MSEDRGPVPPGPILQDRDLDILRGLFESRVMTAEHISTLYFEGRREAAKKRLQRLKAAGIIRDRPRRPYQPAVLLLAAKGLRVVNEAGILRDYPRIATATREAGSDQRINIAA